ncbi:restriction endonuclease subunit S [Alteromonas sp. ASW11-36]|uniref:Restriction endonuclease subunit S n=1 Tax=Alteromonas arenosi TaxID=3055817 RepID=A0ABT7T116_9ALTE|nr:restriction endonuclease subunit S [Alteromonas sp. ASW11-36]MDM7861919.1 restriction endonuclease subunit S [Alteromonas sp. ASW11-36]
MSWPLAPLNEHVDILSGFAFKSDLFNTSGDGLPLVRIRDVVAGESETYYSGEYSEDYVLENGDMLIGMDGDFNRARWKGGRALLNQRVCKVTAKADTLDQSYLYHFLPKALAKIHAETPAVTVKHLSVKGIRNIEIPLPPLDEQKRIAAILDKADAIRRKRQQAIQLADDFLRAVFLDMFGDPVTNPKGWETKTVEQLISDEKYALKRGPFGGALKKEIFVDEGYLVYEQFHALNGDFSFQRYFIDEAKYLELKAFSVKPKDILVSCSGVNLGRLAEVPLGSPEGIINQALMKITLNQKVMLNAVFIDIFSNPSFKKAFYGDFRGAAIPNFPPMSAFKEFKFIVPPIKVQEKYTRIRAKLLNHSQRSENMDGFMLFEALSQKAFSGEL